MEEQKILDRRQFTLAAALAALSGVVITISEAGCGSDSPTGGTGTPSPSPTPTPAPVQDKMGVVSNNHGHVAVVTGAQLTAGGAVQLNIQGTASHPHTVEITAADITAIKANQQVAKSSSTDNSHNHTVTFN